MPSKLLPPPTQLLTDPRTGAVDEAWYRFFEAMPEMLDEDDMVSDSATAVPSQQSVKAYVDASIAALSPTVTVLISGTVTNQTSLDLALDGYTDYTIFKLIISNLFPATATQALYMRFSDDGGATFEAGAADYDWVIDGAEDTAISFAASDTSAAEISLMPEVGNAAGEGAGCEATILNPAGALMTRVMWNAYSISTGGGLATYIGAGGMLVAGASTDVRVLMSSGNITCNYSLVGIS